MGVQSGLVVHMVAAAIGVAAVLLASAQAFLVLKLVGAAYLVYLGVRALRDSFNHQPDSVEDDAAASSAMAVWRESFVANVLNPKATLFFADTAREGVGECRRGRELMQDLIDSVSHGAPNALSERTTLVRTLKRRAADVLAYFDRPGTSNRLRGSTDASRAPPRRRARVPDPTNYIARSLLKTGGFRPHLHPGS